MLAAQPAARTPGVPILLRDLQSLEEGLGSGAAAGSDESKASAPPAGAPAAEALPHRDRTAEGEAFDYEKAIVMMERESRRERLSGSRPPIFAALALVLAVLGIGVAGFTHYAADPGDRGIEVVANRIQQALSTAPKPLAPEQPAERGVGAGRMQEKPDPARMAPRPIAPAPVADATQKPATAPVAPETSPPPAVGHEQAEEESLGIPVANPMPPEPPAPQPGPLAHAESLASGASRQAASAGIAPAQALPRAKQPTAEVPQQQRAGTARVILSVSPRGEIYIDGKHHGTTPPITTFDLEPGMHRIEVRSGSRSPYLTYVTVQTGDVRRIRHDFDVSRAVYPPRSASWRSNRAAR
jgi:hypothetical protein